MASVGDLTIDLNIAGDGKGIDALIGKVKTLDKAVVNLNKNLKQTDSIGGVGGKASVGSVPKTPREKTEIQLRREALAFTRIELGERRAALATQRLDSQEAKKEEKEEEKRRKAARNEAKKFFGTIQDGFQKTLKVGLGVIGATGGAIGIGIAATSQAQLIASIGAQQGINSQDLQRWRNVLTQANTGLGGEQAVAEIAGLQSRLANNTLTGEMAGVLAQLGLSPRETSAISVLSELREVGKGMSPELRTTLLGGLGLGAGTANAFNTDYFSDQQFNKAYNLPISADSTIEANRQLAQSIDKLRIIFDNLAAKILAKFGPTISDVADTLENPDAPGNRRKIRQSRQTATVYGVGTAAAAGLLGAGPIGAGILGGGAALYGAYQSFKHDADAQAAVKAVEDDVKFMERHLGETFGAPDGKDTLDYNRKWMRLHPEEDAAARAATNLRNDNSQINTNVYIDGFSGSKEEADRFADTISETYDQKKAPSKFDFKQGGH